MSVHNRSTLTLNRDPTGQCLTFTSNILAQSAAMESIALVALEKYGNNFYHFVSVDLVALVK